MSQILVPRTEQAGRSPAEVYDECFVPALFRPWGPVLCDAANIVPGQRVLDVACGTGALTVAVAERVAAGGAVLGLDANPEMLAVARRKRADIEWHDGRAESLPFADASFDAVVSQFGLMFFDDPVAALCEMQRVLRPGGRLAVAVCDALDHSPGYSALAALLDRLFGKHVGDAFRSPFVLGDAARLRAMCDEAGIAGASVTQREGTVRFASIDALVSTERACVWTLGGLLDDAQFERLLLEARSVFQPFVDAGAADHRRTRFKFAGSMSRLAQARRKPSLHPSRTRARGERFHVHFGGTARTGRPGQGIRDERFSYESESAQRTFMEDRSWPLSDRQTKGAMRPKAIGRLQRMPTVPQRWS